MSLEIIKQKDVNILSTEPIISEENLNIMNETSQLPINMNIQDHYNYIN